MHRPPATIHELVEGFADNIKALKAPGYKESQLRLHYLDPLWKLLGWDVENVAQQGPADVEVIVEPSVDVADSPTLRSRRPDYIFRIGGTARFVVEAKKPAIDLDTDHEAIFQAKRYAWSSTIPFAILTDFEQFRVYDTSLKPHINAPDRGRVDELILDYHQYPAQWDVLRDTFGRDAVANHSLEKLRAKVRKIKPGRRIRAVDGMLIDLRGDEPVDRAFLACLDTHRKHFANAIYRENRKLFPDAETLHGAARLTEAVQRLMDRLVFMRVCEDRDIAKPWGGIRDMLNRIAGEGGDLYQALRAEFSELNRSYNGYLFKPHDYEEMEVDGAVLSAFICDLYPPDGPWDFRGISDDLLGMVYERFIGDTIRVEHSRVVVKPKPEYERASREERHKKGIYYTPRFVVDTILRRVVGPKVKGKTPTEVLDIKILDPACGSGSFLVAAFQYLFDHCLAAVQSDPSLAKAPTLGKGRKKKTEIAFQDKEGRWYLAPDFRAALLTSCIHGVDIDQQAVEVTVMSLYLKMLESKLPENWQQDWVENRLLPPLDNNIRCGNSLISEADYDAYPRFTTGDYLRTLDLGFGAAETMPDALGHVRLMESAKNAVTKEVAGFGWVGSGRRAYRTMAEEGGSNVGGTQNFALDEVLELQNGQIGLLELDRFGRVDVLRYHAGSPTQSAGGLIALDYAYDLAGNRTQVVRRPKPGMGNGTFQDQDNTYDALSRLIGFKVTDRVNDVPTVALDQDWTLDLLGNWTERETSTPTPVTDVRHFVDERNRIESIETEVAGLSPTSVEFKYDAAGNMAFDGTYAFQYDAWNRLVSVHRAQLDVNEDIVLDELVKHHTYDALGRLARTLSP